jgi:hypothetical protein
MEKSTNMESRVMKKLVNTKN